MSKHHSGSEPVCLTLDRNEAEALVAVAKARLQALADVAFPALLSKEERVAFRAERKILRSAVKSTRYYLDDPYAD